MYAVSDAFKEEINKLTFISKVEGKIVAKSGYEIPFTSDTISQGSFSINGKCVSGNDFEIGSVYAQELSVTIKSEVDRYTLYDAKVFPTFYLLLSDGTWESVPLGEFNITEAIRSGYNISIKAVDNMVILDDEEQMLFTSIDGTPWQLLSVIADVTKVGLAQTQLQVESLPNGGILVGFDTNDSVKPRTFRDVLSFIATLTGTIAVIDRLGRIELRQYSQSPNVVVNNKKKSGTSISDYSISYQSIKAKAGQDIWIVSTGEEGQEYTTHDIPFFENIGEQASKTCLENILLVISKLKFVPSSFTYSSGNPSIDLGDMIEVEGAGIDVGKKVRMLVMSIDWKFRGQQSIKCLGSNPILAKMKSKEDKELSEVISKVGENELIYNNYTNSKKYTIKEGQEAVDIIKIAYLAKKETSGEFKAQIHFESLAGDSVLEPIVEIVKQDKFDMIQDTTTKEWTKKAWTEDVEVITGYNIIGYNSVLKFTYRIDDNEIDTVYPEEVVEGGKHMIWLYYPLERITAGLVHKFEVLLNIIGEPVVIDKLHINAMLIGQGMASMKFVWDGTLTFEEEIESQAILFSDKLKKIDSRGFTEKVEISSSDYGSCEFNDELSAAHLSFMESETKLLVESFTASQLSSVIVERQTIFGHEFYNISKSRFIKLEGNVVSLETEYKYLSHSKEIDNGNLEVCVISDDGMSETLGYEVIELYE